MTEQQFSARYEKTRSFEMQTRTRDNGAPDVTVRLRPKSLDERNGRRLADSAPGALQRCMIWAGRLASTASVSMIGLENHHHAGNGHPSFARSSKETRHTCPS